MGITSAVGRLYIRERGAVPVFVNVDAVPDGGSVLLGVRQNAHNRSRSNVNDIVDRATTIWEPSHVTSQESQTLLACDWSWRNAGVQTEQVRDWSRIFRTTSGTDRGRIHDERE